MSTESKDRKVFRATSMAGDGLVMVAHKKLLSNQIDSYCVERTPTGKVIVKTYTGVKRELATR